MRGSMVTYRWIVDTNHYRDRGMLKPSGKIERSRDSKSARADAITSFCAMLGTHADPDEGATARLERTDRFGTEVLVRLTGAPTVRDTTSGRVLAGRWTVIGGDAVVTMTRVQAVCDERARRTV